LIWALGVLPIWAIVSLLNLIWGALIVGRKEWRGARLLAVAACVWLVGVPIDFGHYF
jgi:hypothetical protein